MPVPKKRKTVTPTLVQLLSSSSSPKPKRSKKLSHFEFKVDALLLEINSPIGYYKVSGDYTLAKRPIHPDLTNVNLSIKEHIISGASSNDDSSVSDVSVSTDLHTQTAKGR